MRDAALAIDETLSASVVVDVSPEKSGGSVEDDAATKSELFSKYETMWGLIADGELVGAAQLLVELEPVMGASKDLGRARRILHRICDASLDLSASQVTTMVAAIKAKALLEIREPAAFFEALLAHLHQQPSVAAGDIEKVVLCGRAINIPERELSKGLDFSAHESIEYPAALGVALRLNAADDPLLKKIARDFFDIWLAGALSPGSNVSHLFQACRELAVIGNSRELPEDWFASARSKLDFELPHAMQLIFQPLLGSSAEKDGHEPASMERHFVPTGLPRVAKLPFLFHPTTQ